MASERPAANPWLVTFAVMLATFMELLDTTVVNVSIPHISGTLGGSIDEGTWVVTSYLVANAMVLPMSGWLALYFGRKRLLLLCIAGFTISSVCCGLSTRLDALIFFRVLQGLSGGGLQPLAQAIMLESFPKEKYGHAMAAYAVGILFAPIIGPTLGGWITDEYSWPWIFYLNLPVGIFSLLMVLRTVRDPQYIVRPKGGIDVWGMGFLALGFGTLQVVLDTGQRKDWFSSNYIRFFAVVCVLGLVLFVARELTARSPVVDLRALRDRSLAAGTFLIFFIGFLLYASLLLLPLYVQTLLGYPALQAGLALSPRGVGSLTITPLVGYLTAKTDPRRLTVFGLFLGAITMLQLSRLNLNAGYWDIFWPQVMQGMALPFLFIPISAAALSQVANHRMGNATSIMNLVRNIGGSFGIAMMTTLIARRAQVHQNRLGENITAFDPQSRMMFEGLRHWFLQHGADPVTASRQAAGAMYAFIQRHAAMLSFVEAFWVMAAVFLAMLVFVPLLRNPRAPGKRFQFPLSRFKLPDRDLKTVKLGP